MIFFRWFKKFNSRASNKSITRENVLAWGTLLLAFFLIGVLVWDGYFFYTIHVKQKPIRAPAPSTVNITPQEINGMIQLFDQRQEKFNQILNSSR